MCDASFLPFEEAYKQGLVNTASMPRVALLYYERVQRLLKQALLGEDAHATRRHLQQAHAIMTQLAGLFMQAEDPAYRALCHGHDKLAHELAEALRQPEPQAQQVQEARARVLEYQQAWRQQLQIKQRFGERAPGAGLNVRRVSSD